jgi:hypothetical protein
MYGSVCYHHAETIVPATCCAASSEHIVQPLQNLHVDMTSNILFTKYELMVNQTVNIKELQ